MADAPRDENHVPTLLGVSSVDGVTPVTLYADPTTHRLLTDAAAGMTNPMTTGGDLIYGGVAGVPTRLANGSAGQVLTSQGTTLAPIWSAAGAGDMVLASVQTNSGAKTFLDTTFLLRNVANTFNGSFVNTNTGNRVYTLQNRNGTLSDDTDLALKSNIASPTFTGTVTIPTPFTLGAVSVTSTGTQLNYLNAATGTTGTASTNLVFSTSPTLVTPVLGAATATSINGLTITTTTGTFTLTNAKVFSVTNTLTLSGTDSTVMTFPTTSKTIAANDGSNWTFGSQAIGDLAYASSATAFTRLAAVAVGQVLSSAGTGTAPAWSSAPQITTIELGNASDTTLSRSRAGILAVEGIDIGYLQVPQNSQSAAYTTVLADGGKSIDHPSSDANARTFTIDSNANVAYAIGTTLSFSNMTSQVVTIAITADTMYLAGTGTTGSRSLAQYGTATARKLTSTTWLISGVGLT